MGWLETIAAAVVFLGLGLYLLLGVAIIVTALVERRPVKFLAPAESNDPERQRIDAIASGSAQHNSSSFDPNPDTGARTPSYAAPRIQSASRLGFTAPRLFKHGSGGIYKTVTALMVSHSRQILAAIRWGTTASIRNEATILYSALEDGRYLVTSDRPTGGRTPGFYDEIVFLGADFDQLVHRHEARVRASSQGVGQLSPENPLQDFEAIHERRARFLVANGDAYWVDPDQTAFRSTLKGALKMYRQTFSTSHVDRSLNATVR